ncbi:MAG: OmpA/MotB family protein [Anaerolineae bacterium]
MAHRQRHEEADNSERWLLTYADMITLLLVFFIVLYSMANIDREKFIAVAASMARAFGRGGGGLIAGLGNGGTGVPAPILFDTLPQQQQDFLSVGASMAEFAERAGLTGDIAVNMTYEGVVISLSEALVFEPGGAELSEQAKATLAVVADVLEQLPNAVRVEAHTDNVPTNSPIYPTNWELSVARSVAIVRYLAEQCGIDASRLSAAGYGEYRPLVPNDTREHRAINRRAEIVILYPVEAEQFDLGPLMDLVPGGPPEKEQSEDQG